MPQCSTLRLTTGLVVDDQALAECIAYIKAANQWALERESDTYEGDDPESEIYIRCMCFVESCLPQLLKAALKTKYVSTATHCGVPSVFDT
jgi:hypothetical protein